MRKLTTRVLTWLGLTKPVAHPREGFWRDAQGNLLVGYYESSSNLHYGIVDGGGIVLSRSSADWPDPLTPVAFREGVYELWRLAKGAEIP